MIFFFQKVFLSFYQPGQKILNLQTLHKAKKICQVSADSNRWIFSYSQFFVIFFMFQLEKKKAAKKIFSLWFTSTIFIILLLLHIRSATLSLEISQKDFVSFLDISRTQSIHMKMINSSLIARKQPFAVRFEEVFFSHSLKNIVQKIIWEKNWFRKDLMLFSSGWLQEFSAKKTYYKHVQSREIRK